MNQPATQAEMVEFDTVLAAIYGEYSKAQGIVASAADSFHRYANDKKQYFGRRSRWMMTDSDAEAKARGMFTDGQMTPWDGRSVAAMIERVDTARVAAADAWSRIDAMETIYRMAPWARFFLVTSSDGHIHSGMNCSTCYPQTTYGWLPQLSGLTDADAVASQGTILCSVCFPSAPVAWTVGKEKPVDPNACVGSGKYGVDIKWGYRGGYGKCSECGTRQSCYTNGNIRKHRAPKENPS